MEKLYQIKRENITDSMRTVLSMLTTQKQPMSWWNNICNASELEEVNVETYESIREYLFCQNEVNFKQYASLNKYYQPFDQERDTTICRIKLLNVAHYLNTKSELKFGEAGYSIATRHIDDTLNIIQCIHTNNGLIYFKSKELAEKAIEILGEHIIRQALRLNE